MKFTDAELNVIEEALRYYVEQGMGVESDLSSVTTAGELLERFNKRDSRSLSERVNAVLGTQYEDHQLSEGTWECPDPDEEENRKRRRQSWPKDPQTRAIYEEMEAEAIAARAKQLPSPTGHCVYLDHDYDECIFCGDPEERK